MGVTWATPSRGRRGFTLVEVLLAVVVLGLIGVGIAHSMQGFGRQAMDERNRSYAVHIARNEIERLRAAGPGLGATAADTFTVDSSGNHVPGGPFTVAIGVVIRCDGGPRMADNAAEGPVIMSTCSAERPTLTYSVTVSYQSRRAPRLSVVRYDLAVGEHGRATGAAALWPTS